MASKLTFFGVPDGEVRAETPDGVLQSRDGGCYVDSNAYDGRMTIPAPIIPGDYDYTQEVPRKK